MENVSSHPVNLVSKHALKQNMLVEGIRRVDSLDKLSPGEIRGSPGQKERFIIIPGI